MLEYISKECSTIKKILAFALQAGKYLPRKLTMSNELHLEGAGHEPAPEKKGVYKELRANPYLLGLSTVSNCL